MVFQWNYFFPEVTLTPLLQIPWRLGLLRSASLTTAKYSMRYFLPSCTFGSHLCWITDTADHRFNPLPSSPRGIGMKTCEDTSLKKESDQRKLFNLHDCDKLHVSHWIFFYLSYNIKSLLLQLKYKILPKNIIVPLLGIFSTAVQAMVIGLVKKKKERERQILLIFLIYIIK